MNKIKSAIATIVLISSGAYAETLSVSDDRLLTEQDLRGFTKGDLRLARNEIFARHGYTFDSAALRAHFEKYTWYNPIGKNVSLSPTEQQNVEFIKMYEESAKLQRRLEVDFATSESVGFFVIPEVPVMIYREYDLDPCALGQIGGLNPESDGFLSVRSGPGTGYTEIDRLYNGDQVQLCDGNGGNWSGIVYVPRGQANCETNELDITYQYKGTCSSGWISKSYITVIAG